MRKGLLQTQFGTQKRWYDKLLEKLLYGQSQLRTEHKFELFTEPFSLAYALLLLCNFLSSVLLHVHS